MKKAIKALFVLLFMILTISGASHAQKNKSEIKTMANYIAVFDFEVTTGDKGISRPLTESVRRELVMSGKYEVIDRGNMNKILGEQKFQMSGCVAQECIVDAGQLLGVGKIVSGSVGIVGKTYYLTLQLIDVKTGKVEISTEDECRCEIDELLGSTRRLAKKLLSEKIGPPAARAPEPAVASKPAESEQKITHSIGMTKVEQPAARAPKPAVVSKPAEPEQKITHSIGMTKVEQPAARAPKPAVASKPAEPETKITNSIGMTLVYIRPGTFMMGSPSDEPGIFDNETQRQVTLTRGFYIQTTEVTQGQWRTVMGNNPSYFSNCGDDCPVENVSWNDTQEFIRRLNRKEGDSIYRLPTEAEWEHAARAGTSTPFNTGKCLSTEQANYNGNYPLSGCSKGQYRGKTIRAGSFSPNAWGLYDMSGNVWEWCQDWKGDYQSGSVTGPAGPLSGSSRVNRGGGWGGNARSCRSASRGGSSPGGRGSSIGFRLAR